MNQTHYVDGETLTTTNRAPSIYYIGEKAVLSFESNKPLAIPINGVDLDSKPSEWSVKLDGVVPAMRGEDYEVKTFLGDLEYPASASDPSVGPGNALIVLKTNYTSRLRDGDQLTITVDILNLDNTLLRAALSGIQETESVAKSAATATDIDSFQAEMARLTKSFQLLTNRIPQYFVKTKSAIARAGFPLTNTISTEEAQQKWQSSSNDFIGAKQAYTKITNELALTTRDFIAASNGLVEARQKSSKSTNDFLVAQQRVALFSESLSNAQNNQIRVNQVIAGAEKSWEEATNGLAMAKLTNDAAQLKEATNQLRKAENNLGEANRQKIVADTQVTDAQKQLATAQEQVTQAQNQIASADSSITQALSRVFEREQRLAGLRDKESAAERDASEKHEQLKSQGVELRQAQKQVEGAKTNLLSSLEDYKTARASAIAEASPQSRSPVRASGNRRFVLYSSEGYRNKFLATRVPLHEIKAFPLPDQLVKDILGPRVVEGFYVVALTVQNDSSQDRLINTGLINAYGRAVILPIEEQRDKPIFTIPVQISPQSLQQVYAVISGSKWKRNREWIFRSLDFSGELATAIATGFAGSPDLIKALGIYTGVGIPALQKLWPDQVPTYLGNIVNFGMPELIKTPQHGSIGYKLLFFSKDDLQTLMSDPSLFKPIYPNWVERTLLAQTPSLQKPTQKVVYMSFDTLEVPFETVVAPSEGTIEGRLANVQKESVVLNSTLGDIQNTWLSSNPNVSFTMNKYITKAEWADRLSICTNWTISSNAFAFSNPDARKATTNIMTVCEEMLDLMSMPRISALLVRPGLDVAGACQVEAQNMIVQIQSGRPPELYSASVASLENKLDSAKKNMDFFLFVAQQCGQLAPVEMNNLLTAGTSTNFTNASMVLSNIVVPVVRKASSLPRGPTLHLPVEWKTAAPNTSSATQPARQ